jgi:hypothetical protein
MPAAMVGLRTILIFTVISASCLVALSLTVIPQCSGQIAPEGGAETDDQQLSAEALEREVRSALPPASSLTMAKQFLAKRGLEYSFDAQSNTVFAIARKVRGSTWAINKSLTFKFHFDDRLALKSIDTEIIYTGP